MEQIVWSDNYSVGVKLFDEQHKRLIVMLNKMIKNPAATTKSETISDVLTDMTQYALQHFKSEEELMSEYEYPLLAQHKSQHKEFKEKVLELCTATIEGAESVPKAILEYLKVWLIQHILNEDMKYKPFFEKMDC